MTKRNTIAWLIVLPAILSALLVAIIYGPHLSGQVEEIDPETAAAAICEGLGYKENARVTVTINHQYAEYEYEMSCGEARAGLKEKLSAN